MYKNKERKVFQIYVRVLGILDENFFFLTKSTKNFFNFFFSISAALSCFDFDVTKKKFRFRCFIYEGKKSVNHISSIIGSSSSYFYHSSTKTERPTPQTGQGDSSRIARIGIRQFGIVRGNIGVHFDLQFSQSKMEFTLSGS